MVIELLNLSAYDSTKASIPEDVPKIQTEVVGVLLSIPSGTTRVKQSAFITSHYTHLRFTMSGFVWVCSINKVTAIAGNLVEVDYNVDFLKSLFSNDVSDYAFYCLKSTDAALWSNYLVDGDWPTYKKGVNVLTRGNYMFDSVADDYYIVYVMGYGSLPFVPGNAISIWVANAEQQQIITQNIMNGGTLSNFFTDGTALLGNIIKCYIMPQLLLPASIFSQEDFNLQYIKADGTIGSLEFENKPAATGYIRGKGWISGGMSTEVPFSIDVDTGLSWTVTNFQDIEPNTTASIYIPFIGQHTLELSRYIQGNTFPQTINITANFIPNYIDGTVTVYINNDFTHPLGTFSLPTVPLYSSNASSNEWNILTGVLNNATASVGNAMAGNYLGVASNAIDASMSALRYAAQPGKINVTKAEGAMGIVQVYPYLGIFQYDHPMPYQSWASEHGYRVENYILKEQFSPGHHYWLDGSTHIKGEQWFQDGVLQAFQQGFEY